MTTELHERGGKTTLKMTVRYASSATRDAVLESGMSEGVATGYDRLAVLLPSIEPASLQKCG